MTIIDISPPLSPESPLFPGDTRFSAHDVMSIDDGDPVTVSAITLSPHTGAHADAPKHYDGRGASIDEVGLEPYLGRCAVLHVMGAEGAVTASEIVARLDAMYETPPRILLRTFERQPKNWDENFRAIDPAAIHTLNSKGVTLIGVDTPSLDPASSKTMDAHRAIRDARHARS